MRLSFHLLRLLPVLAIGLVLAACGNKGPLVMPQKPVPVEVSPASTKGASAAAAADAAGAAEPQERDGQH